MSVVTFQVSGELVAGEEAWKKRTFVPEDKRSGPGDVINSNYAFHSSLLSNFDGGPWTVDYKTVYGPSSMVQ